MPARISGPPNVYSLNTGCPRSSAGTAAISPRGLLESSFGTTGIDAITVTTRNAISPAPASHRRFSRSEPNIGTASVRPAPASRGVTIITARIASQLWCRTCEKASASISSTSAVSPSFSLAPFMKKPASVPISTM